MHSVRAHSSRNALARNRGGSPSTDSRPRRRRDARSHRCRTLAARLAGGAGASPRAVPGPLRPRRVSRRRRRGRRAMPRLCGGAGRRGRRRAMVRAALESRRETTGSCRVAKRAGPTLANTSLSHTTRVLRGSKRFNASKRWSRNSASRTRRSADPSDGRPSPRRRYASRAPHRGSARSG